MAPQPMPRTQGCKSAQKDLHNHGLDGSHARINPPDERLHPQEPSFRAYHYTDPNFPDQIFRVNYDDDPRYPPGEYPDGAHPGMGYGGHYDTEDDDEDPDSDDGQEGPGSEVDLVESDESTQGCGDTLWNECEWSFPSPSGDNGGEQDLEKSGEIREKKHSTQMGHDGDEANLVDGEMHASHKTTDDPTGKANGPDSTAQAEALSTTVAAPYSASPARESRLADMTPSHSSRRRLVNHHPLNTSTDDRRRGFSANLLRRTNETTTLGVDVSSPHNVQGFNDGVPGRGRSITNRPGPPGCLRAMNKHHHLPKLRNNNNPRANNPCPRIDSPRRSSSPASHQARSNLQALRIGDARDMPAASSCCTCGLRRTVAQPDSGASPSSQLNIRASVTGRQGQGSTVYRARPRTIAIPTRRRGRENESRRNEHPRHGELSSCRTIRNRLVMLILTAAGLAYVVVLLRGVGLPFSRGIWVCCISPVYFLVHVYEANVLQISRTPSSLAQTPRPSQSE